MTTSLKVAYRQISEVVATKIMESDKSKKLKLRCLFWFMTHWEESAFIHGYKLHNLQYQYFWYLATNVTPGSEEVLFLNSFHAEIIWEATSIMGKLKLTNFGV